MTTRGNVARCKVTRGYVAARYCRRGTVARGNVRAVVSRNPNRYIDLSFYRYVHSFQK